MAAKDITEKLLENFNDVFADIVNVLLFDGERRVQEDDLAPDIEAGKGKGGWKYVDDFV